jgi:hypothetical protein
MEFKKGNSRAIYQRIFSLVQETVIEHDTELGANEGSYYRAPDPIVVPVRVHGFAIADH